jgi:DNA repair protein RadC
MPRILMAHDCPRGDPEPSPENIKPTEALVRTAKLLDITLLDLITVSSGKATGVHLGSGDCS